MRNRSANIIFILSAILTVILFSAELFADTIILDAEDLKKGKTKYRAVVPYVFYSDDLSLAGGIAGGTTGYFQDQLGLFGALMYTTNQSFGFFFKQTNLKMPLGDRLFLNTEGYITRYTKYREYIGRDLLLVKDGAGSNDSDKDDYIRGKGWNNRIEPTLSYVLPIGVGADYPINTYILDQGILTEGATCRGSWNPFKSGRTFLDITPFFHWQNFNDSKNPLKEFDSNGLAAGIRYDNTDFYINPTKGSAQRFEIRRDLDFLDSNNQWTALELEFNKYFSLGECSWFKQQVIALDFWTAYSPTMKYNREDGLLIAKDAPPDYYGANLGGLQRLRGYHERRFHDKAAIYYCAEYRVIPSWQPLKDINWLRPLDIDWWEFALFAEAGRVAPKWSFSTLNSDLKFDGGVSLRVMAFKSIGRLDFAVSDEEYNIIAFIGHPF